MTTCPEAPPRRPPEGLSGLLGSCVHCRAAAGDSGQAFVVNPYMNDLIPNVIYKTVFDDTLNLSEHTMKAETVALLASYINASFFS